MNSYCASYWYRSVVVNKVVELVRVVSFWRLREYRNTQNSVSNISGNNLLFPHFSFVTVCPNGIINITAPSGSLKYPTSGNYGVNETKCWKIEVPYTYGSIRFQYFRSV